ncbi:MAG: LamG domain-containing protein [Nanoarchaeota archaeon]|nr:LamG domain-containing protein [Nanoarchaeota archaeon]
MKKRGQSAMEYLLTYGWAILVVLVALSALFYLGVFSPSTPNTCNVQSPFVCADTIVYEDSVGVSLGGSGISSTSVNSMMINGESCVADMGGELYVDTDLSDINSQFVMVRCVGIDDPISEGSKVSTSFGLTYTGIGSDLSHNIIGQASGSAEEGNLKDVVEFDPSHIIDDNIVLAYDFEDVENDVVPDLSEEGNDGALTLTESANCNSEGIFTDSKACEFDGNGDYINIDENEAMKLSENMTIEAWVKNTGCAVTCRIMMSTVWNFNIKRDAGENKINYWFAGLNGGGVSGSSTTLLDDPNKWYHVVLVYDYGVDAIEPGAIRLYVNGNLDLDNSAYGNLNIPTYWKVGGQGGVNSITGLIDSIVMYGDALTERDVREHYCYTEQDNDPNCDVWFP